MAAIVPVNTVEDCMALCGVPALPLFDRDAPTHRVSDQIFLNSFETCMNTTIDDVKDAISSFTKLTVAAGRIGFQPGVKRRMMAFVQWSRSQIRIGNDPQMIPFPIDNIVQLLQDLHTCYMFDKRSTLLATQAKPKQFTEDIFFADWAPTF